MSASNPQKTVSEAQVNDFVESLNKACRQSIKPLPNGYAETVEALWRDVIKPLLPPVDKAQEWHKTLMEYVKRADPYFVLRGANSKDFLRRGFLTRSNEFSFFYSDNDHACYYAKMAMAGTVASPDTLWKAYDTASFPVKFGRWGKHEQSLSFLPKGPNPGFGSAGYKLSHIHSAGEDYAGPCPTKQDIFGRFFPLGVEADWTNKQRSLSYEKADLALAKEYAIAMFLRLVHPFNYFLTPAKKRQILGQVGISGNDVGEYQPLIDYVRQQFWERYGKAYDEYLKLIMPLNEDNMSLPDPSAMIDLRYSATEVPSRSKKADTQVVIPRQQGGNWNADHYRFFLSAAGYRENTIKNYADFVNRAFADQTHGVPPMDAAEVNDIVNRFANELYMRRDNRLPYGAYGNNTGINSLKRYRDFRIAEAYCSFLQEKYVGFMRENAQAQISALASLARRRHMKLYENADLFGYADPAFADFKQTCPEWFA